MGYYVDTTKLRCFNEISRGTYGIVYKGIWHGSLVAAKILPTQGIASSMLEKELNALRYVPNININIFVYLYMYI